MLTHPDLVTSAPRGYKGLQARVLINPEARPGTAAAGKSRRRYKNAEIAHAIARSPQMLSLWDADRTVKKRTDIGGVAGAPNKYSHTHAMPQYISAYMALLGDDHPHYKLVQHTKYPPDRDGGNANFPPRFFNLEENCQELMSRLMDDYDVTPEEVREAFEFEPEEADMRPRGLRRYSVRMVPHDSPRWALMLLMVDAHPYCRVVPRDGHAAPARRERSVVEDYRGRVVPVLALLEALRVDFTVPLRHRRDITATLDEIARLRAEKAKAAATPEPASEPTSPTSPITEPNHVPDPSPGQHAA